MTTAPYIFPNPDKVVANLTLEGFRIRRKVCPMNAVERKVSAESKVTYQDIPLQSAKPAPRRSSRLVLAGYVAAIVLATLGWLKDVITAALEKGAEVVQSSEKVSAALVGCASAASDIATAYASPVAYQPSLARDR